jgi:hypothetical protein
MAEEEKKPDGGDAPPPETILDTAQRDPDEAAFAEQAILEYAHEVLASFGDGVQSAVDAVAAWVESQNAAELFNNAGFAAQMGDAFLQQMLTACGGKDTPIGAALFEQLDGEVDQAARSDRDVASVMSDFGSSARDFAWYLRDNLQSVLSNQWDQLRDLAYEGSTDFIPAIHAFGLPEFGFSPTEMQSALITVADATRQNAPKTQQEAVEQDPEQKKDEQAQILEESAEKQQTA